MNYKKLYRSLNDKKIAGVCGGLGEYFNIDPTLIRVIFLALFLGAGIGLLLYLILWLVVPNESQKFFDNQIF
ncbi:MAG: PspC domain-containing protein [Bacteroidales bacterium]|jgi:phage shock protein C|nr:PspC domain-containing protein [Bacteroidales bacterium]